eukprot:TRINITY_DN10756_c0_g1_i1.p1 TRINITY_DN10756_c0_g1~~TRINITY_DN10756_c0_g1_i1.p1  ORF type:complete len:338 (+),score=62.43 TRINITY_DN10756_c0_g1_i1:72-1085(+)
MEKGMLLVFFLGLLLLATADSQSWGKVTVSGTVPIGRASHGQACDKRNLYIFGGNSGVVSRTIQKDIWTFDTGSSEWKELASFPDDPLFRINTLYDQETHALYTFGGAIETEGILKFTDKTWKYDIASNTWIKLVTSGTTPSPRAWYSAVLRNGALYVHGGQGTSSYFNDLYKLDLKTLEWSQLNSPDGSDPPRFHATAVLHPDGSSMYAFGGIKFFGANGYRNDVAKYNFVSNTWEKVEAKGALPSTRAGHTAVIINNKMIVFGGNDINGRYLNDLWSFEFSTATWTKVSVPEPLPAVRSGAHGSVFSQEMLVFGGFHDLIGQGAGYENELWRYQQ